MHEQFHADGIQRLRNVSTRPVHTIQKFEIETDENDTISNRRRKKLEKESYGDGGRSRK